MPILTTMRQSPLYLYCKTYCLCATVTIFQAAPVSALLPHNGIKLRPDKRRNGTKRRRNSSRGSNGTGSSTAVIVGTEPLSQTITIFNRWLQRATDLAQIKKYLQQDDTDRKTYPELEWDATVRRSSSTHPEEQKFILLRKERMSSQGASSLHSFLDLPPEEKVDPRDAPLIALGGSGGGYRAMFGFAAFISASKRFGLWDCVTWTAGVSGSCWTLAAYYTIGNHDTSRLKKHYLSMAKELAHPMSIHAVDTISRSSKGVYFLIGPLLRKVRSGIIGLGIMDLYATLMTTYQFISREPGARLSRATFQFSKVWTRSGIDKGLEPMPIFTAVRRAPKDSSGVKPHTDSSLSKGQPPKRALIQHQTGLHGIDDQINPKSTASNSKPMYTSSEPPDSSLGNGFFQWFEISPLEAGSPDVNGYIPTWSWGRTFVSGRSVGRSPEQSLSLILGQCTSAPAGPLTGYISALLASLPKGTIMSRLLLFVNNFIRMKRWDWTWGNPIRAGHDPNPFYGHNNGPQPPFNSDVAVAIPHAPDSAKQKDGQSNPVDGDSILQLKDPTPRKPKCEAQSRVRLMDSGMSNNLPSHILSRPERGADIILAFDASSDVQTGSAIKRIQNFADDCNIEIEDRTALFETPRPRFHAGEDGEIYGGVEIEEMFLRKYTRVFRGIRETGEELWLVYCPLLPNGRNPGFDPSTASFSTSYNLVWTPEQIQTLFATSEANFEDYSVMVIRQVVKRVYLAKKEIRLALETKK